MHRRLVMVALFALCAGSTVARAQGVSDGQGKTREEARRELEQAWREGELPFRRREYPPTPESKKRNKERYERTHPEERGAEPKESSHRPMT
ncbi:hypothetical protein NOV72_01371 [Caballeronia novacaledonica]|uniref:DUF4148 domain-containing protein n=2 Tax=Caballeronia novacaledonica TaxID=1544861 RepID=A0A2U3I1X4_9BURK|nr:DUF4148 domain-containing protein [Caballeronia novacaledonica]SPB14122.1 hypothetical protein NOV72_01371 [Caballeronia novacaledonica]